MSRESHAAERAPRRLPCLIGSVLLGALLAGCSKSGPGSSAAGSAPTPSAPSGATLAVAGQLLTGSDSAALRSYLQSVKEVQPKRFDVKWNPAAVPVGREEALRSLRTISQDGSTYTFAASEQAVGKIKRGNILWIWDVALRKVDSVENAGDTIVIHTRPVALTEALSSAKIEFDSAVGLRDYYMAYRPHHPRTSAAKTARVAHSGFYLVGLNTSQPDSNGGDPKHDGDDGAEANKDSQDDWGEGTPARNGFNGELKGFDYSIAYDTRPNGLTLTLEARKGGEGGEGDQGGEAGEKASDEGLQEMFKEAQEQEEEAKQEVEKTSSCRRREPRRCGRHWWHATAWRALWKPTQPWRGALTIAGLSCRVRARRVARK